MTAGHVEAERLAAAIGPLSLMRARARSGRHAGMHPRRKSGSGSEFWQYRTLEPGEPADKIDWRRSARSDDLFVREREREDPVRLWLFVDGSASMDFASSPRYPTKRDAALRLVGALGLAANEADESCLVPPRMRPLRPERLLDTLSARTGSIPEFPALGPSDVIVAAGDFLDDGALDWVKMAATNGALGVILAVQDRAEIAFPFSGRVRFEAIEADDDSREVGRAESLAVTYHAAWTAHMARLTAINALPGWTLIDVPTDAAFDGTIGKAAAFLRGKAA